MIWICLESSSRSLLPFWIFSFQDFRIISTTLSLWSAELSYNCWNCDIYGFDHVWPESPLDTLTVSFIHDCCFDWTPQCEDCLWFAASTHSRNTRKNTPNIWLGIRGQTHLPYGLMWTTIGGQHWVPKGFVWLGAIWLNPVLHNPQPTPSAWRPRCVAPARPAIPSNTTADLSFTGFYSLRHPFPCSN